MLSNHLGHVFPFVPHRFLSHVMNSVQEVAKESFHGRIPSLGVYVWDVLLNWQPRFASEHKGKWSESMTGMRCCVVAHFYPFQHRGPVWAELVKTLLKFHFDGAIFPLGLPLRLRPVS